MHIINDFFLLIWQEDSKNKFSSYGDISNFLDTVLENNFELFCDYASILLIVSNENINSLKEIKEAKDALKYLSGLDEWDKKRIQFTQKELLFFLNKKGKIKLNKEIEKRFDKLRKESIIGYEKTRKLISLLALIQEKKNQIKPLHVEKAKEGDNFYESAINLICSSVSNLNKAIEDKSSINRLQIIPQKLKEQKFSIGVTGVMNAGKSTMLNALLGKEILGTSVIPETANLTVIKYAKNPSAVVNFWKKDEWNKIEESANYLENLKPFVDETKKIFSKNLDEFITQDGLSQKIKIDELPSYTSAEHSGKKCNLVKSVELYTDLKFVENGVEIVDTPGLDDPVIQREEITKNYLLECDLMIHLMNVNQSATQKDVEFIIDSLLYQNVARLLIVITRIDTVSKEELEEVITYTKRSIKEKLTSLNKENSFDAILNKIDFIPIAGYMALLHRTGRKEEALKAGYDLENSGILKVENYLEEVLFGKDSQKAKVIVDANKKEIINIIKFNQNSLNSEIELLSKSSSEIANEYNKYQEEILEIKKNLENLNLLIDEETNELKGYFSTLKRFAQSKINSLKDIVKRRVCDDFSYEVRKNNTKPKEDRIAYIIETALKDGFIDLTRDYRYQFSKKIDESFEKISREFEEFSQIDKNSMTDSKEFFNKHFSHINFTNSNVLLIQKVNTAIKSASKKDIDSLCEKVDVYFEEAMQNIYQEFDKKVKHINDDLVLEFTKSAKLPMQNMQESMKKQEEILNLAKQRIEDKSFDTSKRVSECEQKLKLFDIVLKDLEDL